MYHSIYGIAPHIDESVFVARSADIIGNVEVKEGSSIWYQAVIRGDNDKITVNQCSNIQDGAVLHTDPGLPLIVDSYVTVGHKAVLHGCRVKEHSLIGINAVILNGAQIGPYSIVGANSLVTENQVIPEGVLALGTPARVVRKLTDEEKAMLHTSAEGYVKKSKEYKKT